MPRSLGADETGGLYHALIRGNLRADIFRKDVDDRDFFVVCCYVERNALRANLVDRAENLRWGSL